MKQRAYVKPALCILLLLAIAPAWAQMPQPFSADYSTTSANGEDKVAGKMYFSMPRIRIDYSARGQNMAMIVDSTAHVMYFIMPAQQLYMEFNTDQSSPITSHAPYTPTLFDPSHPCAADATCKKVGTETVNGRVCDKWVTTDKAGTSTSWIDQKLLFPIKRIATNGNVFEVSNLKEGRPDASLFQVPAGYRKMEMPAMGGGRPPR